MNKNKKGNAGNIALEKLENQSVSMKNHTTNLSRLQFNSTSSRGDLLERTKLSRLPERKTFKLSAFVCDDCCLPLHLYGANFIETYSGGKVNILRCLCDTHAEEFELEVAK